MVEAVVGAYRSVGARNSILHDKVEIAGTGEIVARTCADHMLIHGRHETGCISNVEITSGENSPLRFELRGSDGTLAIHGHHPGGYQCGALTVAMTGRQPQPAPNFPRLEGNAVNVAELWQRFENDIRTGARTVPDFAQAVKLHRLLDAIELASDETRTVAFGES
jgi:predicted dehydrogenase